MNRIVLVALVLGFVSAACEDVQRQLAAMQSRAWYVTDHQGVVLLTQPNPGACKETANQMDKYCTEGPFGFIKGDRILSSGSKSEEDVKLFQLENTYISFKTPYQTKKKSADDDNSLKTDAERLVAVSCATWVRTKVGSDHDKQLVCSTRRDFRLV